MYSHGPHIDVTDLELSPIVGMWSDIFQILNSFSGPWADMQNWYLEPPGPLRLMGADWAVSHADSLGFVSSRI